MHLIINGCTPGLKNLLYQSPAPFQVRCMINFFS
jgi:hypothetical protein